MASPLPTHRKLHEVEAIQALTDSGDVGVIMLLYFGPEFLPKTAFLPDLDPNAISDGGL